MQVEGKCSTTDRQVLPEDSLTSTALPPSSNFGATVPALVPGNTYIPEIFPVLLTDGLTALLLPQVSYRKLVTFPRLEGFF